MKSFRLTQISPIYQSIRQFANPQLGSGAPSGTMLEPI